ncbi:hypothetical protein F0L74_17730 [Chitinophaga agrisoli]|uniref:Esterase n=1 Tax=Chitinophaga agrisoli TaxID=2607653 RepID=A0A5B2VRS3_9BACT|nr:hypothetical protein [Chitinophaga agrisoli]KAA2241715.1 hypothetical protein F0L74_17730 [Chitinophaga agrisoli]
MTRYIPILYLCLFAFTARGQQKKTIYRDSRDSTHNFYVIRPPREAITGLLVLNDRGLSDSAKMDAWQQGIMILTVVPAVNSLDNLTSNAVLDTIDDMIAEVLTAYKISTGKVVIGGMSAAGTGAVRYAEYCYAGRSKAGIKPVGVFAVDPPLDYERLWNESNKAVERNFSKDAAEEGKTLLRLLNEQMKGTPRTRLTAYQQAGPFSYSAKQGGNAYLLNRLAVRLYTEPDINWWITNRHKDFYDLNAIDNAALINQLQLNGNTKAELIITSNKGIQAEGHPHSWSILDQKELLIWCNKLFTAP